MLSCLVGSPGGAEETEGRESSPGRRWSSQTAGLKGLSSTSIKRGLLNIMSQRTPNSQLPGSNRKSDGSSGTSPSNLSENGDLQHAQASRMEVDQGMQDSSSRDFKKEFVSADRPTGQEDMRKQWNAVGTPISRDKSPSMDVDQGGVTQGLPAFEIGLPAGTDGGAPPAVDSPGDTVMSGSREAEQALGVPMVTTPGTDFHGEGPEEAGTLLPLESRPADEELQAEGTLEDCLKLLRSGVDEQRLVGLLLATKFVSGGDLEAVNHIFHAIGFDFIDRLLQSAGYGEGASAENSSSSSISKGPPSSEQQQAYAQLAFGILSAFCRLPDLAAEPQLLGKVPLFVSVLKARGGDSIRQDVYECLLGVASASDFGFSTVKEEEAVPVVLADLAQSTQEMSWVPLAVKLLGYLFSRGIDEMELYEWKDQLAASVPALARELAGRHDVTKFETLSLLLAVLSPEAAEPVRAALAEAKAESARWAQDMRTGIGHILHSRIDVEKKQAALRLARVAVEVEGEPWLAGPMEPPLNGEQLPADRFFVLLVESLRVEIPLLLSEMARRTFEELEAREERAREAQRQKDEDERQKEQDAPGGGGAPGGKQDFQVDMSKSANWGALLAQMGNPGDWANEAGEEYQEEAAPEETGPSPELQSAQRMVAECYALLEHMVEAMSSAATATEDAMSLGDDEDQARPAEAATAGAGTGTSSSQQQQQQRRASLLAALNDSTVKRAVSAVDDVVGTVLEFVEEAKKHELSQDAGVLASVRLVGKYLAEAPGAHRKQVSRLLSFMLSVKSDEEDIPVQAVRFLLPALLQLTTDSQGCNSLVKRGGHKFVVGYVQESARTNMMGVLRGGEDAHHGILEASDVLLNIFGNREGLKVHLDALDFAPLLAAMVGWSSASGTPPKQKATVMAMAACIIASVMELASEEELKKKLDLASYKRLPRTMKVIVAFLEQCHQATGGGAPEEERDLWDIVVTICTECMPQWPYLKRAFITSPWWEKLFGGKPVTAEFIQKVTKDPLLVELLAAAAVP